MNFKVYTLLPWPPLVKGHYRLMSSWQTEVWISLHCELEHPWITVMIYLRLDDRLTSWYTLWPWPSFVSCQDIFTFSWQICILISIHCDLCLRSWHIFLDDRLTSRHLYTVTLTLIGLRSWQAYVLISIHCDLDLPWFKVMTDLRLHTYSLWPRP